MKRILFITLIVVALILVLTRFLPHSLFKVDLGTQTPLSTVVETALPTPTEPQEIPVSYQDVSHQRRFRLHCDARLRPQVPDAGVDPAR